MFYSHTSNDATGLEIHPVNAVFAASYAQTDARSRLLLRRKKSGGGI
jgi:hypothetical protein